MKNWVSRHEASDMAISVVTVLEIEVGILRRERTDLEQARILRRWFEDRVLTGFSGRILAVDLEAARRAAPLHVPSPAPGHDALIAATALAHGLTVVTRNVSDFERTGVEVLDPWAER